MRLEVGPPEVQATPGTPVTIVAQIFNTDDVINAYEVRVFGVDPTWVHLERERLSLFPAAAGIVAVAVDIPVDYPAGPLRLAVEVSPVVDPDARELREVAIHVTGRRNATLSVDPLALLAGRTGSFNLTFVNEGNAPFSVELTSTDPEAKVTTTFASSTVELLPGEHVVVPARTRARRPLVGAPSSRMITFSAKGADNPLESLVSFVQRPLLGRGLMSIIGLLIFISVFAMVLTNTLGRVVDVAQVDAALLKRAIEGEPDRGVPDDPGVVAGRVSLLSSDAGVSGVTVEVFLADDDSKPVASAATDDAGSFQVGGLHAGSYKVRYRGAGFVELWFDGALTFADATEIDVVLGETTGAVDVAIGGLPGSIAGVVSATDPADAKVVVQVPSSAIGSAADAQIAETTADADGAFLLEELPAPASYELVVSKPGYTTVTRVVNVLAGEMLDGIEVRLRTGDGLISGVVDVDDAPVGGVGVTAADAAGSVSTISLTTGDVGAFTLRNLPTPATYTVTFAKTGYASESLTIALDEAQQVTGLNVSLDAGTGSIGGGVTLEGEPIGGVTVEVSDGESTITTETLSVGAVGTYLVSGLPLPGLYTVRFSGPGMAAQVRSVDLDPTSTTNATGVDAALTRATAIVGGTVSDPAGPASGVTVELSDGETILTTTSADDPEGQYVIENVPPGTYTITFRQLGAVPRSVLLTLAAGEERTVDVELDPQASISGTVTRSTDGGEVPLAGAQVLVYLVDEFPTTLAASTVTDEDGDYVVTDLEAPEEYIVEFAYPEGALPQVSERVTLDAGEERDDVDATLTLAGDE